MDGSLQIGGASSAVSLTGSHEDSTGDLTLSGGGFSFTGRLTSDGQTLLGRYSGPTSGGRFSVVRAADGPVSTYCGTFTGAAAGRMAASVSASGIISGHWTNAANRSGGTIGGQRSGNTLSLTSDPEVGFAGTQLGNRWSGTWDDATGGGTWEASVGGCQRALDVPSTTFRLNVATSGSGDGEVRSSPEGIECGTGETDCLQGFQPGTVVTLTATAATGSSFVGWTGHADCADGKVTMSSSRTCTARFTLGGASTMPTLSVSTAGDGGGTVTSTPNGINCGTVCDASYDAGTVVTLKATPDANSRFVGWSGDGDCSNGIVTMSVDRSCVATFARFTLTVSTAGTGQGTVTSSPSGINCGSDCVESFTSGTVVTLKATPASNSMFVGWSGNSDCSDGRVTMSTNRDCVATFTLTPQISDFYGTYNVSLDLTQDDCGDITYATSASITLSGAPNGSNLTVVVTSPSGSPAGNEPRTYQGSIDSKGRFSASGSGGTPFALPRGSLHGYDGQIDGQVTGTNIAGEEVLNYMIGCIAQVRFDFSGSR